MVGGILNLFDTPILYFSLPLTTAKTLRIAPRLVRLAKEGQKRLGTGGGDPNCTPAGDGSGIVCGIDSLMTQHDDLRISIKQLVERLSARWASSIDGWSSENDGKLRLSPKGSYIHVLGSRQAQLKPIYGSGAVTATYVLSVEGEGSSKVSKLPVMCCES